MVKRLRYAPLAQLDRVAHYECEGRRFESCMARQTLKKLQSSGFRRIAVFCAVSTVVHLFYFVTDIIVGISDDLDLRNEYE